MAEEIFGFSIVVFTALIMIVIGIVQIKSKNPVGFYSGKKPPKKEDLVDVTLWNKKHGKMWIIYGLAMIGSYLIYMVIFYEFIGFIIFMSVIVGGLLMMCYTNN